MFCARGTAQVSSTELIKIRTEISCNHFFLLTIYTSFTDHKKVNPFLKRLLVAYIVK